MVALSGCVTANSTSTGVDASGRRAFLSYAGSDTPVYLTAVNPEFGSPKDVARSVAASADQSVLGSPVTFTSERADTKLPQLDIRCAFPNELGGLRRDPDDLWNGTPVAGRSQDRRDRHHHVQSADTGVECDCRIVDVASDMGGDHSRQVCRRDLLGIGSRPFAGGGRCQLEKLDPKIAERVSQIQFVFGGEIRADELLSLAQRGVYNHNIIEAHQSNSSNGVIRIVTHPEETTSTAIGFYRIVSRLNTNENFRIGRIFGTLSSILIESLYIEKRLVSCGS
jgi:hypothetical protein